MNYLHAAQARGEIVTGLLYVDPEAPDLHAHLDTAPVAFNALGERELCPGNATLERINAGLR
jgi:2-oxoglutarate ferredoxin oxidoreductase subunit beta